MFKIFSLCTFLFSSVAFAIDIYDPKSDPQYNLINFQEQSCHNSYDALGGCQVSGVEVSNAPAGTGTLFLFDNGLCNEFSVAPGVKANGRTHFKTLEDCQKKHLNKEGDYYELVSNECKVKQGKYTENLSTIFSKKADCDKKLTSLVPKEAYSNEKFSKLSLPQQKDYCAKLDMRFSSKGCKERSALFGSVKDGISNIDGSSILSGAGSLAEDIGIKDGAKRKLTLKRNPDQFFREYCDEPRLDNDCMKIITKPGKEDIYIEKICEGDPIKTPECETKFMALHKENAKAKYITDVCEDAPADKLKCRMYYKQVKGLEKYYIDLCSEDKEKEPECNKEKVIAADPSRKIFEKIHCSEDETNRDARCPKIVEEKEEEDAAEPEESEDEDSDEEESDEEF